MQPQIDGEKRRHPRFEVRSGVIAVVKSDAAHTLGQTVDVSQGGLGLTYVAELGPAVEEGTLDLFAPGGIWYLKGVPVRTASDVEMPNDVPFSIIEMRRMGVAFGVLTDTQERQLHGFISENRVN